MKTTIRICITTGPALLGLAVLLLTAAGAGAARADEATGCAGVVDRHAVTLGRLVDDADAVVVGRVAAVSPLAGGEGRVVDLALDEVVKGRLAGETIRFAAPARGPGYTLGRRILAFLGVPRTAEQKALAAGAGAGALVGPATEWAVIELDAERASEIVAAARGRVPTLDEGSNDELRRRLLREMASEVRRVAEDAAIDLWKFRDLAPIAEDPVETGLLDAALGGAARVGPEAFRDAVEIAERAGATAVAPTIARHALELAGSRPEWTPSLAKSAGQALRALDRDGAAEWLVNERVGDVGARIADRGLNAQRANAARLLGEVGGALAEKTLGAACDGAPCPKLRTAALAGLTRAAGSNPDAVKTLLDTLMNGTDAAERAVAAAALCDAGGEQATGALRFAAGALADERLRALADRLLHAPELARPILDGKPGALEAAGAGD